MTIPRPIWLVAAAALLSPAAASAAAEPASDPPSAFGEVLDVRVVNLEVVVTDRRGERVEGLSSADFRLLVDGEEVPIDYFTEIRHGAAVEAAAPAAVATETEAGEIAPAVLAAGERVGSSYLLFIDDHFTLPIDRNRLLDDLERGLALGPDDRLAMVRFDGTRIEMLTSWTRSPREIEEAFDRARRSFNRGLQERANEQLWATGAAEGAAEFIGPRESHVSLGSRFQAPVAQRQAYRLLHERITRTLSAAGAALRGFGAPPGRKVMLMASGGWTFEPPARFFLAGGKSEVLFGGPWGEELYRPLIDQANRIGYTIYGIDAPGMKASSYGGAADVAFSTLPETTAGLPDFGLVTAFASPERDEHNTLHFIAEGTGGRALINAQTVDSFERVATDVRSYYWLGFTPPQAGDDRTHRVEVELRQPGLRVRSRDSYLDLSRSAEATMRAEAALLFGPQAPLPPLAVEVGESRDAGRGRRVQVPLRVAVPLDAVTLLPQGEGFVSEFEIRIAARDERGNLAPIPVLEVTMEVPDEPRPGDWADYRTTIELRRRSHELLVTLHDPITGATRGTQVRVDG